MKFAYMILGLKAANGTYGCPLCITCKHRRCLFIEDPKPRIFTTLTDKFKITKQLQELGHKLLPLLRLPINHIIVDELHLILRVAETLLTHLIVTCKQFGTITQLEQEFKHIGQRFSYHQIRPTTYNQREHLHWLVTIDPLKIFEKEKNLAQHWRNVLHSFVHLHRLVTVDGSDHNKVEACVKGFHQALLLEIRTSEGKLALFQPAELHPTFTSLAITYSVCMKNSAH